MQEKTLSWTNGPLVLYHGTTDDAASAIKKPARAWAHGIDLDLCKPFRDFGRGFYLTTVLRQAESWADRKFRQHPKSKKTACSAVLRFEVDRNQLAPLLSLCFVTESAGLNSDYWDFVQHCRKRRTTHLLQENKNYDVVFGPVSLGRQRFVIKDADQVSFHTEAALKILPPPILHSQGTPTYNMEV